MIPRIAEDLTQVARDRSLRAPNRNPLAAQGLGNVGARGTCFSLSEHWSLRGFQSIYLVYSF